MSILAAFCAIVVMAMLGALAFAGMLAGLLWLGRWFKRWPPRH